MMQCASNYMWCDPRPRGELGMMGGSALARNFIPSDNCAIAACDEDSAFTFVQVPEWMEAWCAGPPLIAAEVWHLLTDHIRASVEDPFGTYVAPLYRRLAMGSSHSVYLLMKINSHSVGQMLLNHSRHLNQSPRQNDNDDISTVTDSSKPLYQTELQT